MLLSVILFCSLLFSTACSCHTRITNISSTEQQKSEFQETLTISSIINSPIEDGPDSLQQLNRTLKVKIAQAEFILNDTYERAQTHAQNSNSLAEIESAHQIWQELKEKDAVVAARGEHGATLARYLYLNEKLKITEDRIQYLKRTFNLK